MCHMTFTEFDIRHRMATTRNVVFSDLDLHIRGRSCTYYAFVIKKMRRRRMSPDIFASIRTADAVELLLLLSSVRINAAKAIQL